MFAARGQSVSRLMSFPAAAAAILLALPAVAADSPQITGAGLAACRAAADEPICLLRLAMQARGHQSYRENPAVGYAPQVLAAIGPDPSDDPADMVRHLLRRWGGAEAVKALVADHAGADPQAALQPVRDIPVDHARNAADQPKMERYAAERRIEAYKLIWEAGHGDSALPPAHRPSPALAKAALAAWRAELPNAGDEANPKDLAAAYRQMGDAATAEAIAPRTPDDRLEELVEAGRYAEAAAMLDQLQSEPRGALTAEGRMEAGLTQMMYAAARGTIIRKAVAAGQVELAVRLSEADLEQWLSGPAKDPDRAKTADFATSLQVGQDILLIAEKAPRLVAVAYAGRLDQAGRDMAVPTAPISALAAMRGWTRLGEPARAKEMMSFWAKAIEEAGPPCTLADIKRCAQKPAVLIPMGLKAQPLDTPWDELAVMSDSRTQKMIAAGPAGIDTQLAKAQTPRDRISLLFYCSRESAIEGALPLAAYCARRLIAEPAEAAPRPLGVESALRVAAGAARSHDEALRKEMLALAFAAAEREPGAELNGRDLEDIAIAELRAEGRL